MYAYGHVGGMYGTATALSGWGQMRRPGLAVTVEECRELERKMTDLLLQGKRVQADAVKQQLVECFQALRAQRKPVQRPAEPPMPPTAPEGVPDVVPPEPTGIPGWVWPVGISIAAVVLVRFIL